MNFWFAFCNYTPVTGVTTKVKGKIKIGFTGAFSSNTAEIDINFLTQEYTVAGSLQFEASKTGYKTAKFDSEPFVNLANNIENLPKDFTLEVA